MTGSKEKAAALVVAIIAVAAIGGASWRLYRRLYGPEPTVFPDADGNCPRGYHYQDKGFVGPYEKPMCCPPGTACD